MLMMAGQKGLSEMTVREFIKKYNIKSAELRIYDSELNDEVWRPYEVANYMNCEVQNAYPHNGDTVLQVNSIRG